MLVEEDARLADAGDTQSGDSIAVAALVEGCDDDRAHRLRQRQWIHLHGVAIDHPGRGLGGGGQLVAGHVDNDRFHPGRADVDAHQHVVHGVSHSTGSGASAAGGWATTAVTPGLNVIGPAT